MLQLRRMRAHEAELQTSRAEVRVGAGGKTYLRRKTSDLPPRRRPAAQSTAGRFHAEDSNDGASGGANWPFNGVSNGFNSGGGWSVGPANGFNGAGNTHWANGANGANGAGAPELQNAGVWSSNGGGGGGAGSRPSDGWPSTPKSYSVPSWSFGLGTTPPAHYDDDNGLVDTPHQQGLQSAGRRVPAAAAATCLALVASTVVLPLLYIVF